MADKPNVLVLGGVGFIGRNFVAFLVAQGLANKIRVVDKVLPATAFLSAAHEEAFKSVEYKQANLTSPASIAKAFTIEEGGKFNLVFNLAAETKYGQTEEVYNEKVLQLSERCAAEALKQGVDRFVEVSTAQVYDADKKPSKEDSKLSPWTNLAKYKLKAEETLKGMSGLPLVIVRPAIVYGPGDTTGIAPRVITGAVYKHLDEKMKFLWSADLRMNTVHVDDVCRGLWHVATSANVKLGTTWNFADKNDTTQEKINSHLESIFGIKTGFLGSMVSRLAQVNLKSVTEEVNDKHLRPWSDLCKASNITNTPLTPYIDQELLYNNALSVDGAAIESTGFTYGHPEMKTEDLQAIIAYFKDQKLFPNV